MQVLLIADIHANYQALKAVLDRLGSADEIWCLGDIVEFGPCPAQCIDLVRDRCQHVVQGNHDQSCVEGRSGWSIHDRHTLSPEHLDYLRDLPTCVSAAADGHSYFLVHGSPTSRLSGKLLPDTEPSDLHKETSMCTEDRILCGHTHVAMVREAATKLVVNAGTIGQPRDGDYRAQCMLIEDGAIRFDRVEYDLEALAHDYRRSPLPDDLKETWLRYTCQGVVNVHGLQLGPFSATPNAAGVTRRAQ